VPLRVLLHACQELRSAHRRRRPGLARQIALFEALDSPVERVLLRLKRPKQPAGAATAVRLLERRLERLPLGQLLVEQSEPVLLAPCRFLEFGCRLRD